MHRQRLKAVSFVRRQPLKTIFLGVQTTLENGFMANSQVVVQSTLLTPRPNRFTREQTTLENRCPWCAAESVRDGGAGLAPEAHNHQGRLPRLSRRRRPPGLIFPEPQLLVKVFIKLFRKSQFPHKSVNLSLTFFDIKKN